MPHARIILGPKFKVRLEDLTAADTVCVHCFQCGRSWRVPPHRLYERFAPFAPFREIASMMVCRTCKRWGEMEWHFERAWTGRGPPPE